MSQQVLLQALSQRLPCVGDKYIGSYSVLFNPLFLRRRPPPVVRLYPRPVFQYVPNLDIDSVESGSTDSDGTNTPAILLEYRIIGITWYTPRFINSCNLDSFLGAWVRKVRQRHGKFLDFMSSNVDLVGVALLRIADHALCAKEYVNSEYVKELWISTILQYTGETGQLRKSQLDCTGNNMCSVFQHLYQHIAFEIQSSCSCGRFYNQDYIFMISELQEIRCLADRNALQSVNMPYCVQCSEKRVLLAITPVRDSLMVVFQYEGSKTTVSPLLDDIPKLIQLADYVYRLEYITYCCDTTSPGMYHEISLQYIHQQWYKYDSAESQKFEWFGGNNYTSNNARLMAIVYFRLY